MPDTFTEASLNAIPGGVTCNLRDYWPLTEATGNRLNLKGSTQLIPVGSVTNTAGLLGNAATFSGGDGKRLTTSNYPLGAGPKTFVIWFKPKSTDIKIPECTIFQGSGFAISITTWPPASEGLRTFAITSVGDRSPAIFTQLLVKDQWNIVAVRFEQGQRMRCYINGTLSPDGGTGVSPLIDPTETLAATTNLTIGGVNTVAGHTTGQDVGPVMVFDSALTEGQLDYLYNAGTGRALFTVSMSATPTQVGTGVSNQTIVLTGNGTNWDAGNPPTVTVSGVTGTAFVQRVVNSPTNMTVTVSTGSTTGTLTISDTTNNLSTTLEVVSLDPNIAPVYPQTAGYWPASQTAGDGSSVVLPGTEATCRGFTFVAPDVMTMPPTTMMELVFNNHSTKSVTFTISIQRQPGDVPTRLTFGGANSITVPAGAFFKCDPIQRGALGADRAIPTIARLQWAGAGISVATYSLFLGLRPGQVDGWNLSSSDVTLDDAAFSAGINATYRNCWGACTVNIEGYVGSFVLNLGDSLSNGFSGVTSGLVPEGLANVAHYNMAAGGDALSNWFQGSTSSFNITSAMSLGNKIRAAYFPFATDIINGYGHNDIYNGVAPSLYLARANAMFTRADLFSLNGGATSGKRIQWTLTPKTTKGAGDSWATITDAQQTIFEGAVSGGSVNAASVNSQLFATPAAWGATALLDMATLSRSPNASGLYWASGDKTTDGSHIGVGMSPAIGQIAAFGPWTPREAVPTITGAAVGATGRYIDLTPSEPITIGSVVASDFTLTYGASNTPLLVSSVALNGGNIRLTLASTPATPIYANDTNVLLDFAGGAGKIIDSASNSLAAFTDTVVTVTSAPAAPVVVPPATINTAGDQLTIPYDSNVFRAPTVAMAGYTLTLQNPLPSSSLIYTVSPVVGVGAAPSLTVDGAAVAVTNNSTVDNAPPTVTALAVSSTGLHLDLTCSEAMALTSVSGSDFSLTYGVGNTPVTVSSVSLLAANIIRLTLASRIYNDDTNVLLDFVGGANKVEDVAGNDLAAFTNSAVTVSSAPASPVVAPPATVNAAGSVLTVPFDSLVYRTPTVSMPGYTLTLTTALPASSLAYSISPVVEQGTSLGLTVNGGAVAVTNGSTVPPSIGTPTDIVLTLEVSGTLRIRVTGL